MEQNLRFGIVGTGMIANVVGDAIEASAKADLVAVSSRRLERAKEFARNFGSVKAFDSWQAMVAWEDVDAIYVATPTVVREEICLAAARNKKHVLADKPFADLPSLQRITSACRTNKVAFMDGTHFVHHPRTAQLKREMRDKIGPSQAVRTAFFFPFMDRSNIRFNPDMEPTGALGDMAWYSMRASVEFLPTHMPLDKVEAYVQRDPETGAVIRAAGLLVFEDGATSVWDVGYNCGACIMDLDILGTNGLISLDDFVLDWAKGFAFDNPSHKVGYTFRTGMAAPSAFEFVETPSAKPQHVLMIEDFIALAQKRDLADVQVANIQASERTQSLLDAVWDKVRS